MLNIRKICHALSKLALSCKQLGLLWPPDPLNSPGTALFSGFQAPSKITTLSNTNPSKQYLFHPLGFYKNLRKFRSQILGQRRRHVTFLVNFEQKIVWILVSHVAKHVCHCKGKPTIKDNNNNNENDDDNSNNAHGDSDKIKAILPPPKMITITIVIIKIVTMIKTYNNNVSILEAALLGATPCKWICQAIPWKPLLSKFKTLNSLWPSDTIWRRKSWSTLVQVMACCLTAATHLP